MIEGAKVLIVDDSEANRVLLTDLCEVIGVETECAVDGVDALKKVNSWQPDLILLDLTMPNMDGRGVLQHLKKDDDLSTIPVVIISGVDDMANIAECIQLGADDYLVKPFEPTLLSARIRSCVAKKQAHDKEIELSKVIKNNYDKLKTAVQSRDALAHMIVHDLNNPLAAIKGYAQLMLRNKNDEEKVGRYSGIVLETSEKMFELIQEILDVSKFESGSMDVQLEQVDSAAVTQEVIQMFEPVAKERDIVLDVQFDADHSTIMADKNLVKRVLQNLVSNALKHSPKGSQVKVSARESNGSLVFKVTDNGDGIPLEFHDKIFDKYFQVSGGKNTERSGVGLGLAFCKMAADAQGGHIWLESDASEKTAFSIALPIVE